jgi:hypothetical protein
VTQEMETKEETLKCNKRQTVRCSTSTITQVTPSSRQEATVVNANRWFHQLRPTIRTWILMKLLLTWWTAWAPRCRSSRHHSTVETPTRTKVTSRHSTT